MAVIRSLVAEHGGRWTESTIAVLGEGCDHISYLVDDGLVVRFAKDEASPDQVEAEMQLLRLVAEVAPLPVPAPVAAAPQEGCLAYELLPGTPLLEIAPDRRSQRWRAIAEPLGRLLGALHAVRDERFAELVDIDDLPPEEWLREAVDHWATVGSTIPRRHHAAVKAFLGAPPPVACDRPVFSHNDLGIEHVLVDPATLEVTGVIDWSDAALVDPAYDFGLLLRDLGAAALDAVLAAYDVPGTDEAVLRARALFHARCALLEDLAFGLAEDRALYVDKSLAALPWLFPG